VVISASFDLSPKQDQSPYTNCTIEEMQEIRRQKQPAGISCGSYFANPKDHSAGKLIDDAGLKGYSCGAMQISPKHGNFFINTGGATWQEVLQLAEHAKQEVFSRF
jgi:UDP-N-acetylmuramate dehydrogenase